VFVLNVMVVGGFLLVKVLIDMKDFKQKLDKASKGIAFDLQESLKSKLSQAHGKDTGMLQSSILGKGEDGNIDITMLDYAKYLEFGISPGGKLIPIDALMGWVKRKMGVSDDKEAKSIAFAIAKHIQLYGSRPFPFIRNTFENDLGDIIKFNLRNSFK